MGLFDFLGSKKDSGRDAGNAFTTDADTDRLIRGQIKDYLNYQSDPNVIGTGSSDFASKQVMDNPLLGQVFGKGGTLERTGQEEKDLAGRGYSLKPEDMEAYGQMSDQMAREFGGRESSLASALSGRGLSFSGGHVGSGFSGLMGNKQEMLGTYARQIANDRMNTNMQRLGQTRQFLTNLSSQGQGAVQDQWGRNMSGEQQRLNVANSKNQAAFQRLSAQQEQSNENLQQRQQTEKQMPWAQALQSVGNTAEQAGMAYATGGMSAIGGPQSQSTLNVKQQQPGVFGNQAGGTYSGRTVS
jgi:hypothetical protein